MDDSRFEERALEALRELVRRPDATFRDGQLEAISALVRDRRRALVVQRTGWGKSAVYFVATRLLREEGAGPTLIVSPLLALMRNQIASGTHGGVRSATMNSDNRDAWDEIATQLDRDEIDVLLVSPERFANAGFRNDVLPKIAARVGLLVVDEVHCISDWGHDFRPDYRRIGRLLDLLADGVPVLGTTATANDRVVADIETQFGDGLATIRGPLARPSLALDTRRIPSQPERLAWLAAVIPTLSGTGIVYCLTVADTGRVAAWLRTRGIDAAAYSGQTDSELRRTLEDRLLANDLDVLVATSALGMGYDKPDLAFVIHYQSPGSPIAYYQQVGRAGRALDHAHGILLSGYEDRDIQDYFIRAAFPPQDQAEAVVSLLDADGGGTQEDGEGGEAIAGGGEWTKLADIEEAVNIRRGRLTSMLKALEVEGAVDKQGLKYRRTAEPWEYPTERIEQVTAQRRVEQRVMEEYLDSETCLMELLGRVLDDPTAGPCGRCSRCTGERIEVELDPDVVAAAQQFLRQDPLVIEPRRMKAGGGRIPDDMRVEAGRALSTWGDGGWGRLVEEQRQAGRFADELVFALGDAAGKWSPDPRPTWVTFVPSTRSPELVASLASRVAQQLDLPLHPVVRRTAEMPPQVEMQNSAQQYGNVARAFGIDADVADGEVPAGPVFLVDDLADSRWTLAVVGARLRRAGSGPVFPLVLATGAPD
ncbi:MAG TPA: RecQ family ATP-dependent DNA helicase [Acidimicrobiia bacterium]|nr:RecQ family ATP-dependent DNA helicase [Acidimicrobiia bacterium]